MAAIQALEALNRPCRVELHTDSQYVHKGIPNGSRLEAQRLADRRQEAGEERSVEAPRRRAAAHKVRWHWIKGHAGHVTTNAPMNSGAAPWQWRG